ncbi:hypothetical protein GCU72_07615 [Vibrio sp. B1Z05]|nr:hypothetical protein [Vibrio sp. B1Z05]MPW36325.1 hypothetical protein [Vibrio sp. B1Z05]
MKSHIAFLLLWVSFSACSQNWNFPVPLYRGQTLLSEVNIITDGEKLIGVNATELHSHLKNQITSEVSQQLLTFGNKIVTQEELYNIGIDLRFDYLDLSLNLHLNKDNAKQNDLSFDIPYETPVYTESGFFAWHNIFNLTANYVDSTQIIDPVDWRVEWITATNFGGYKGLNLDGSIYASPSNSTQNSEIEVYRGDLRAFVDRPSYPLRLTVGDIQPYTTGHLPSVTLGGVALERLWNRLQPSRNIQSGGSQEVYLVESATIAVYINDTFYGDLRLAPGRYSIDDLPLRQGNNDIRLEIRYQSGRREEISYSQFFNTRLLKMGFSDYGIYTGLSSNVDNRKYQYDQEQYLVQSYYEYGLTQWLTVGINGLYHPLGQIGGISLGLGTGASSIGFRGSVLNYDDVDVIGGVASIDYSSTFLEGVSYGSPNFRASVESFYDYRPIPWDITRDLETGTSAIVDYTYRFSSNLNLSPSFQIDYLHSPDRYDLAAQLELQWIYQNFDITLGAEYLEAGGSTETSDTNFYFVVEWDWYSDSGDYEALAQYFSQGNRARASFTKYSSNSVGGYGYQVAGEYSDAFENYEVRADYIGNRYSAEVDVERLVDRNADVETNAVSGRISSGFTMVDSHLSWNRGYRGPAVIVNVHDSLDVPVYINEFTDSSPEAIATTRLSNAVPLYGGHSASSFDVTIPQAPIGYDYGSGYYQITAGTYTGHSVVVGSDNTKTVIGSLVAANGDAIALRNGVVVGQGLRRSIFTNKAGRFAIERMSDGEFEVTIIGDPSFKGILLIENTQSNLIYLSPLSLEEVNP